VRVSTVGCLRDGAIVPPDSGSELSTTIESRRHPRTVDPRARAGQVRGTYFKSIAAPVTVLSLDPTGMPNGLTAMGLTYGLPTPCLEEDQGLRTAAAY